VTLSDVEINGEGFGPDYAALYPNGYTCIRCNIHDYGVGFGISPTCDERCGSYVAGLPVLIQDSWVHDPSVSSTSHVENLLSNGSTAGATIRHNRFDNPHSQTATIALFGDFAPIQNMTFDDNLFNGGGYAVYGGHDLSKPYGSQDQNIKIINNHFMRTPEPGAFFANGGIWGPVAYFSSSSAGNVWSGNVWDDTGTLVLPG
jgi:hypothetical protein